MWCKLTAQITDRDGSIATGREWPWTYAWPRLTNADTGSAEELIVPSEEPSRR